MAKPLPPNPYIDLTLTELGQALSQRAGALLNGATVGRRDVAYLLIAAAAAVRPQASLPNAPARLVAEGEATPLEVFADVLAREQRSLRWWVFRQAVDAAGGPIPGPAYDAASQRCVLSDEDCHAALQRIVEDPPITRGILT